MRTIICVSAICSLLLGGCVAYDHERPYGDRSGPGYGARDGDRNYDRDRARTDRDRDGVPNARDRRPDDPYRR